MFCIKCGKPIPPGYKECVYCGTDVPVSRNKDGFMKVFDIIVGIILIILSICFSVTAFVGDVEATEVGMYIACSILTLGGAICQILSINNRYLYLVANICYFFGIFINYMSIKDISIYMILAIIVFIINFIAYFTFAVIDEKKEQHVATKIQYIPQMTKETKQENEDIESKNIAKLKEYKELLDQGILTKEEFNKKKKELLDI